VKKNDLLELTVQGNEDHQVENCQNNLLHKNNWLIDLVNQMFLKKYQTSKKSLSEKDIGKKVN
jgi:hypothetical protein